MEQHEQQTNILDELKNIAYMSLKETGVALVFIGLFSWNYYHSQQQTEKYLEVIKEQSIFTAQQTEVIRNQTKILEQLSETIKKGMQ